MLIPTLEICDTVNQLTKVEDPSYTEELYYDKAGNRSRRVVGGVEEIYRYDPRNRLTECTKGGMQTTYKYDNAGNLLVDDRARYTYDVFNRTEKVETFDGHIQINRYDAEGLRQELEEDGKLVQFIFRGGEVVAEKTEDNIIRLVRGYDLVASDAENARTYYHYASNELGSITHVVDDHEVLNRYEYDVWGNLAVCEERVPNRFLFTGQQYDPVTQQYYLRARFYNPVIARFTQEDTYRGDGLNLYAYCRNNPVCYVDPSGHWCDLKEEIYQRLAAEQPADSNVSQLELMARAANIAKGKESGPGETIILRDLSKDGSTSGIKVDSYDNMRNDPNITGQAHHLSQNAVFENFIPQGDGLCVELDGNALSDIGSPHYEAHKFLERFWNQYRKDGDLYHKFPTIGEYNRAVYDSLLSTNKFTLQDAAYAVRKAYEQQQSAGFTNSDFVPRIPGRLPQKKGD